MVTQPSTASDLSPSEQSVDTGRVSPPAPKAEAPPQILGARAEQARAEHETIFCLNELLKLQVSIAGSLELACLAFRHADTDLSDAIRRTFWKARELFSHAARVVSQYAEVAQQVGQLVLTDLKLAVDEKEPSLAMSLLAMVKGWVANMKKDGEEIQRLYVGLQESVQSLIQRAQHTKTDADRRLAEAVQERGAEPAPPLSPRTHELLALGEGPRPPNVPLSMDAWTRQLFQQLSRCRGQEEGSGNLAVVEQQVARCEDEDHWKRDCLELLFMAPGLSATKLPPEPGDEPQGEGRESRESQERLVRFVPPEAQDPAFEGRSSASLLRALRELKRVDEILHGCSAFWANMDGTVQRLSQMKEHTEALVSFAANSKALKQRFEERLGEYASFWVSLERVCRQYCMDHQAASKRMYEVIREVADAADVFDTAQSARMGMVLAMSEKQRRHGGAF